MKSVLDALQDSLTAKSDTAHRDQLIRFFKGQRVNPIGVGSKDMNAIVADVWRDIKGREKTRTLELCEALWATEILEKGHIACKLASRLGKRLEVEDFPRFERWLHTTIDNWAHCDDLCTHALGDILFRFPEKLASTDLWHKSDNRWVRRGLAVSMLPSLKAGQHLEHSLAIADRLLMDEDELVLKGYGWMLKVAGQAFPDDVFAFVLQRRDRMPRVPLRYAIEKLPSDMRAEAMKK